MLSRRKTKKKKNKKKKTTEEKFEVGLGTDDGDEYVCSLKVHRLMTQI